MREAKRIWIRTTTIATTRNGNGNSNKRIIVTEKVVMCSNANAKHWHHHRKITIPLYDTIQRLIVRESEQNRKETYRKRKQMLTVIPWRGKIVYERIGCPRIRNVHTHIYTKQMWTKLSGVVKRIAWRKKIAQHSTLLPIHSQYS